MKKPKVIVGLIAQTVSDKLEKYFKPSKAQDTPVEETEKEEEDQEDFTIDTRYYLLCMKPGGPFEYDEMYNKVVINGEAYVVCGQKAYRVYKCKDNGCMQRFEAKNGAQFI